MTLFSMLAKSISRIIIHPLRSCTLIGVKMLVGDEVNIRPQKIAVQSCENFIVVLLGILL